MTHLQDFLEKSYGKKLTETEGLECQNRLTKFVELLIEIDRKGKRKSNETKNN